MSGSLSDTIAALAAVLAENTAAEPPHARALRVAQAKAAFAGQVIDAWSLQELHRGLRYDFGVTKAHLVYAQAVRVWAEYEVRLANWLHDPRHRELLEAAELGGAPALEEADLEVLNARPSPPENVRSPSSIPLPPHWPEHADDPDAVTRFFAALDSDARKSPRG